MPLIVVSSAATSATGAPASTTASATRTPKALPPVAARPIRLGFGPLGLRSPATQLRPIHRGDGLLGFARVGHFNKCKAGGTPGSAVGDDAAVFPGSVRGKRLRSSVSVVLWGKLPT